MGKFLASIGIGFLLVATLAILVPAGCAQDTSCLNQLAPCLSYLNGAKDVPDQCCNPLKSVLKSNPKCLCDMATNQGSRQAEQAGINVTEAQQLPGRCGLHVNPISCLTQGSPNSKNSVDNSSSIFLLPSWIMIVATTISIIFQSLLCQKA